VNESSITTFIQTLPECSENIRTLTFAVVAGALETGIFEIKWTIIAEAAVLACSSDHTISMYGVLFVEQMLRVGEFHKDQVATTWRVIRHFAHKGSAVFEHVLKFGFEVDRDWIDEIRTSPLYQVLAYRTQDTSLDGAGGFLNE